MVVAGGASTTCWMHYKILSNAASVPLIFAPSKIVSNLLAMHHWWILGANHGWAWEMQQSIQQLQLQETHMEVVEIITGCLYQDWLCVAHSCIGHFGWTVSGSTSIINQWALWLHSVYEPWEPMIPPPHLTMLNSELVPSPGPAQSPAPVLDSLPKCQTPLQHPITWYWTMAIMKQPWHIASGYSFSQHNSPILKKFCLYIWSNTVSPKVDGEVFGTL